MTQLQENNQERRESSLGTGIKSVVRKVQPTKGFAHFFHLSLVAIIPPLAYVFVRLDFYGVAIAVVLLSKWRMFALRPRHWLTHMRTNAVDIIMSLSLLSFMITANEFMKVQLIWLLIYEVWVLFIKPGTSTMSIHVQALAAQFAGLTALFLAFDTAPFAVYIVGVAGIAYFSARHFFAAFDEVHAIQYSWLWAIFGGCLAWILTHWLLFYGPVAQISLILSVVGYGLAGLYFLHENDKLSRMVRRQIIFVVFALLSVIIVFSKWGGTIIK